MNENKNNPIVKVFFLSVFLIVLLSLVAISFSSDKLQLSPEESSLSFENAKVLLSAFPPEGIEWYCGSAESYTDAQGNVYREKELEELKKILGNTQQLELEFC